VRARVLFYGGRKRHDVAYATGIRIFECMDLKLDCLRQLGPDQWALHVLLGKLHTERLIPADSDVRQIIQRILILRVQAPGAHLPNSAGLLLPRAASRCRFYQQLRSALAQAAARAGCSAAVTPYRLRHYAASLTMPHVEVPTANPGHFSHAGADSLGHRLGTLEG
jgi:site-specific recombinase XerD